MRISKSTRHAKLTGDFAEALVLYWLSKYGLECARVDHTGIDIIAADPSTHRRMGISVKGRTRLEGTESSVVNIPADGFVKAKAACDAFGCIPYFAIVVDALDTISVFIVSLEHLSELYPMRSSVCYWAMSPAALARYAADPEVIAFSLSTKGVSRWFPANPAT